MRRDSIASKIRSFAHELSWKLQRETRSRNRGSGSGRASSGKMIGSVRETYHESFVRLCIGSLSMAYRIFNYAPQDDEKEKNKKILWKNKVKAKKKEISFAHKPFANTLYRTV